MEMKLVGLDGIRLFIITLLQLFFRLRWIKVLGFILFIYFLKYYFRD